ncbi:hypothetical protein C2G38_2218427 [Gigaspora rosea]|uniref:NTF2 domain-containing protein n=1 Tax=Gigaspora rosea TaxID=44941 RepID=A0A397UF13_9GLOM|nr:hypothetical protein C2G38_2218427 [Gigaspora rosea]
MAETATNLSENATTEPTPVAGQKINSFKVGWLFVHEYYTILNKEPWRLHCFYGRNSILIRGNEGQKVMSIVGEQEIREKIKQLNLDNCRVLVTNVDSQSSLNGGIVVQVLGEMSNGNEETSRKFAQTFFLAEQPNGYYVLNDIFRFLNEDDDVNSECDEVDEGAIEESVGNEGGEEDVGSSPTGTLVEEPINVPTIIEEESAVTRTRELSASEVTTSAPNTNETESVPNASLPLMSASVSEGQQQQQPNPSLVASNDTLNASSDKSQGTQVAVGSPSVPANKIPVTNVAVNAQLVYPNKTSVPNAPIIMPFANQASQPYINQQPVAAMVNGPYQNMKQTTNGQIGNASSTYAQRPNAPRPQTVGSGPAFTQTSSSRTQAAGNSPAFAQQLQTSKVASQTVPHTVNGLHTSAPRSISPASQRSVSPVGNDHKPVQNIVNGEPGVVNQSTSLENGQPAVAKPAMNVSDNSEAASVKPASNVVNGENSLSKSTSNVINGEPVPVKSVNDEQITHTNVQSGSDSKKIGTPTVNNANVKDESAANAAQSSGTNQQATQPPPRPQGPQTWASTLFKSSGNTQTEPKPQNVPATLPAQKVQQKPAPQNSHPPQQQARDNRNFRQEGPRGNNRRNSDTNFSIYVKGISQKVSYDQLKSQLSSFGQIKYLDMVYNKSCAFVVFADEESYKECLNRHTLTIANQTLTFEERRPSRNNMNRGGNNKPPRGRGY